MLGGDPFRRLGGSFWVPKPLIWEAFWLQLGTLGDHWAIRGSPGTPQRTPGGPHVDFQRFLMDFGSPLGATLGSFWGLFRDLGHENAGLGSGVGF